MDHGYYECDDGNLIDGDGCDSNCNVEVGFRCFGGNFDQADLCIEVCGDNKRITIKSGFCDDGNTISGDGCSQLCDVETGWTCIGGSPTSRDYCYEICGDGLNVGQLECDDGNLIDGDGCDSACSIEPGYTCEGGSNIGPDICLEECGDGFNYGDYECDDGNLRDGDGCDSTCMIETEWLCTGGSPSSRDICELYPKPYVVSFTINSDNTKAIITLNEAVMLDKLWNTTVMYVYVDGPKSPY